MILPKGKVLRFKGAEGLATLLDWERELEGCCQRIGNHELVITAPVRVLIMTIEEEPIIRFPLRT